MLEDHTHLTDVNSGDEHDPRPLTIYLERLYQTKSGYFRPGAFVKLTKGLRTSGFLQALPAEDVKNLLFLLTFITPNGDCHATTLQLADVMQVSQAKVKARMQRLEKLLWQGQPVVHYLPSETGLDRYSLAPHVVRVEEAPAVAFPETQSPPIHAAGREAVINHSREHYAHPRADVERLIAEQMGWQEPEGADPIAHVKWRLSRLGVSPEQVEFLVTNFDVERIQRQLDWLPYRNARKPAHFIIAAVEHDYEEPIDLRFQRLTTGADEAPHDTGANDDDSHEPTAA